MDEKIEQPIRQPQTTVPPRARAFNQLILDNEDTAKPSANKVFKVMKNTQLNSLDNEKKYFFKDHSKNRKIAELESYCAAICRFIATSEYVPSVRPYYNQEGEMFGVTSKAFRNFKSNRQDPLQIKDTVIESATIQIEQQQRILIFAIKKLMDIYEKNPESNHFISFFTSTPTQSKTHTFFADFLKHHNKFSFQLLNTLSTVVFNRKQYLKTLPNIPISDEFKILKHLDEIILQLKNLYINNDNLDITVEMMDKLDRALKEDNINLETYHRFIKIRIDDKDQRIKTENLHNYRILKGLAISLTTRFIYKEGDNNNSNMSKQGLFLDFDWTKANILFHYKNCNEFDQLIRHPSEETFACTPNNIERFPDVGDKYLFYWPTKQPEIQQIILEKISTILHQASNLDNTQQFPQDMLFLFTQFNQYLEKIPRNHISYWETTTEFMYQMSINLRSLISGRHSEELIIEDKLKYLFSNLYQQFQYFIKNHSQTLELMIDEENKDVVNHVCAQLRNHLQDLNNIYNGIITALRLSYKPAPLMNKTDDEDLEEQDIQMILNKIQLNLDGLLNRCKDFLNNLETNMERFNQNSFTKRDNEVYRSLSTHPVFIFHKYKTFLKYILTNEDLYASFAKLNISDTIFTNEQGKRKNLHKILVQDEVNRIAEIKNALLKTEDFKLFLTEYGEYAFELIKEEFSIEKIKYCYKTDSQFDYEQIIKALDIKKMEQKFINLCDECNVRNDITLQIS